MSKVHDISSPHTAEVTLARVRQLLRLWINEEQDELLRDYHCFPRDRVAEAFIEGRVAAYKDILKQMEGKVDE